MRQFFPLHKVEDGPDGTLHVEGVASSEAVDSDGEVIKAQAMAQALPDFFRHGTGALREMHQPIAAGRVDKAEVGADGLTTIAATVVDPVAITKVKAGVYKGFSIGGRVTARDAVDKSVITGLRLTEISLVDRPANPQSVLTLVKRDDEAEGQGLRKAGARHSKADLERLQAIHDHTVGMGACCPGGHDDSQEQGDDAAAAKADGPDWLAVLAQRDAALAALDAMTTKAATLERDLAALGARAAPPAYAGALAAIDSRPRPVSKADDSRDHGGSGAQDDTPANALDAIRKAHRHPQRLV